MSKLSFRARALDAAKPMAVYMARELPDLPDFTIINRAVPQMPTGMEKEEESEHHLQRAIVAGLIIPTPEVFQIDELDVYNRCYPSEWKVPRQLIHMQPFTMEQDIPDYDLDSEDEKWINTQGKKLDITPLQFEEMMDRLEKSSGQTVITLAEAKSLLKQDDDFITAVYDYWLNKRLKTQHPLIPQTKTDKYGGTGSSSNPYIAFRRRTEKMQTRKHRKNDEASYEKMLKLRRDLSRALILLEMVKKREKYKREIVHFGIEVYEKRYQMADYSGQVLNEVSAQVKQQPRPPCTGPLSTIPSHSNVWPNSSMPPMVGTLPSVQSHRPGSYKDELLMRKERRNYRKRRHKAGTVGRGGLMASGPTSAISPSPAAAASSAAAAAAATAASLASRGLPSCLSDAQSVGSSEDEAGSAVAASQSDAEEAESDLEKQGPFAFRRKLHCNYLAPAPVVKSSPWPWSGPDEGGLADPRFRFNLTSLSTPQRRCIGFARRRIGRGGRVVLDRVLTPLDGAWGSLNGYPSRYVLSDDVKDEIRTSWRHFRPSTPPPVDEDDPPASSDGLAATVVERGVDRVSIYADGEEDQYQTFDTETIDQLYADRHLERWAAAAASACSPRPTPPGESGNSNFHVAGDDPPDVIDALDWWNFFDCDGLAESTSLDDQMDILGSVTEALDQDPSRTPPPPSHPPTAPPPVTATTTSTPLPAAASTPSLHGKSKNSVGTALAMNGVANSPAAVDSPFWMAVPKGTASLPNSDCSIVSPCPGELHTGPGDKDQTSVADFLLIDSTFAMEVT